MYIVYVYNILVNFVTSHLPLFDNILFVWFVSFKASPGLHLNLKVIPITNITSILITTPLLITMKYLLNIHLITTTFPAISRPISPPFRIGSTTSVRWTNISRFINTNGVDTFIISVL